MPMSPSEVDHVEFLVVDNNGNIYPFKSDAELDEAMRMDFDGRGQWRVFKLDGFLSIPKGHSVASYTKVGLPHIRKPEGR